MSFDNDLTVGHVAEKICAGLPADVKNQCFIIIDDISHLELCEANCEIIDDFITGKRKQIQEQNRLNPLTENGEEVLRFLKLLENKCYFHETALSI